ncbi:putative mediator of RNA polymerase II transcription subunit 12 [Drosophila innubila]|uniref:putative mediator of RNA polymerase II transcription subunit 12 n=1 Tax=Drosophila innubila TaxID=198719 RepID=UPI00148B8646|nr:putative mediator of RNA polymerase II transcription subunit 12 [Drosophila innubila]
MGIFDIIVVLALSLSSSLCVYLSLAVLLICCISISHAEELETKPTDAQVEPVTTTKLTPSVEEPKSKTEKRDSSDQTGSVYISNPTKETAFRPIFPSATYYEAAESDSIFEPTTVRYTVADAAQQTYYGKSESGNIRYAPPTAGEQRHAAVRAGLPGPIRLSQHHPQQQQQQQQQQHQQQQQQHHQAGQPHRFSFAVPPQVELYQRPVGKSLAAQQQSPIYNYVEADPSIFERVVPQQYQLGSNAAPHRQLSLPGHRIQYIIAIPLSYMRQLQQQQLGGNLLPVPSSTAPSSSTTTSTSTSTTTSTATPPSTAESAVAASHPIMQLLGPLARDHQGMYRPYYQSDTSNAPTSATPYGQQYLQIPANVLLAAAQQLQQNHQQYQHQQQQQQQHQSQSQSQPQFQNLYPKAAPTTSSLYQPLIYQSPQPQFQLQRLYQQTPMIYSEQPVGQQTTLYAYPLHQQQHQQHQQHQGRLVRLGTKQGQQEHKYAAVPSAATPSVSAPAAATTTAAAAAPSAAALMLPTATTASHQLQLQHQHQHQQHTLPIVHYNPIYVQAPTEQQQQQHQFAILPRFSNNNPKPGYNLAHESTPPIHVVRLSAASALGHQHQQPQPIHHYQHYQPSLQQQQQQQQQQQHLYQPHAVPMANYVEEQHQHTPGPVSPAIIPYFSHPGAVHYGTHLYHPASGAAVSTASATGPKQQQQLQQQQQRQTAETTATSGRLSGDSGAIGGGGGGGVKQPTAVANIVKYP